MWCPLQSQGVDHAIPVSLISRFLDKRNKAVSLLFRFVLFCFSLKTSLKKNCLKEKKKKNHRKGKQKSQETNKQQPQQTSSNILTSLNVRYFGLRYQTQCHSPHYFYWYFIYLFVFVSMCMFFSNCMQLYRDNVHVFATPGPINFPKHILPLLEINLGLIPLPQIFWEPSACPPETLSSSQPAALSHALSDPCLTENTHRAQEQDFVPPFLNSWHPDLHNSCLEGHESKHLGILTPSPMLLGACLNSLGPLG